MEVIVRVSGRTVALLTAPRLALQLRGNHSAVGTRVGDALDEVAAILEDDLLQSVLVDERFGLVHVYEFMNVYSTDLISSATIRIREHTNRTGALERSRR